MIPKLQSFLPTMCLNSQLKNEINNAEDYIVEKFSIEKFFAMISIQESLSNNMTSLKKETIRRLEELENQISALINSKV